ncbi:transglutaminaseTgpA domain-containing protein [Paraglaciecola sp.]|uniref:transglutaminase family protein n=1 Tax=Paraglaciecola sp. TaxID=1920173 RepID=UPI003EF672AA
MKQNIQGQTTRISLILITVELSLVSFSLFDSVLAWVLLIVACAAIMRGAIYFNFHKHFPSIRTLNLLALLCALGLIYSGMSLGLLIGMVNLLVLACALKLMQVRTQRDVYQLILSLFFLIGCGFIFNQTIVFSIFYCVMSFLLLLSLATHHAPNIQFKTQIIRVLKLSVQAAPIGVLLFMVLPQLPPLWQTPKSKNMETGLSEQITPGDIASLSQSSKLAFRATFNHSVPTTSARYWRAIVMEDFDGKTWKVHALRKKVRAQQLAANLEYSPILRGSYLDYQVIAEPTHQNWLFALDLATPNGNASNAEIFQSNDFKLISHQKLVSQYQYKVRSYPQAIKAQTFSQLDQQLNLSVPQNSNPQTRDWINQLRAQHPSNKSFIQAVLAHFTSNPFQYTLTPPLMFTDPVDQFLFDKQAGFCSHYASALAFSLRLGGIPARIVTGYQGGEVVKNNDQTSYVSVYQYDAHAWVEVWQQDTGWLRVDPTALVSPDRINLGLREAMSDEGSFLADSPFALARLTDIPWLNNIRLLLADVDYNWSRWILGFNQQSQRELFKSILGKITPNSMSLLGLGITAVIVLLLTLYFIPHWLAGRADKTQRYYQQAITLFNKHQQVRMTWQGPEDFSQYVKQNYPTKISTPLQNLTKLFVRIKYQNVNASNQGQLSIKNCQRMMAKELRKLKAELSSFTKRA